MQESVGDVTTISEGNAPVLSTDNRIKIGALGFLGGGALPIGLMLLVGLMDRRYRYSDEAGGDVSGITLLGILPNLPDRLSDPEQAAIAAHCVHQIRTMLQINGSAIGAAGPEASDDRRVFAVTSAAPGDGKTSLTLALGLSYAACGTRTLLIDCDLVGGGLTSRMNVHATEGVLEAITDRSLLPYVRTTDIADVSILPVGAARGHHASTLSPGALRRLINEVKQNFEVILIDTGPILGSIEASLVCAAADGVVLTVARGQQRPMVEKALGHLAAIGARLAGVVFNRAQSSDFERSISGMSMRSIARHPSTNGNGSSNGNGHGNGMAVARAVAGEGKR
jgi:capsular exopolysaccharide synthesis family protein